METCVTKSMVLFRDRPDGWFEFGPRSVKEEIKIVKG